MGVITMDKETENRHQVLKVVAMVKILLMLQFLMEVDKVIII